ncbi:MAG TPA: four helix bundle protein [Lacunisphaera sp.]|nr:four helix bundle protein [Lacunisphaera sp.]
MNTNTERKDDLRQRTKAFASLVVRFYVGLDKRRDELRVLGRQLLRSGTSVAANYRESSRARNAEEFIAKVELCAQEADETQLWLELLREDCAIAPSLVSPIWKEADELIAIFVTMAKRTKENRTRTLRSGIENRSAQS